MNSNRDYTLFIGVKLRNLHAASHGAVPPE